MVGIGAIVSSVVGGWLLVSPTSWAHTKESKQIVLNIGVLRLQKIYSNPFYSPYTTMVDNLQMEVMFNYDYFQLLI